MLKILFLDFDGVLFDTVDEAYEVCIKTDFYINKRFSITSKTDFKKYRPYVGPAWNYYYVMEAIINDIDISKYLPFKINNKTIEFENSFFNSRDKLKTNNYFEWLQLNKKYNFLDMLKKEIIDTNVIIYIITTKDKNTVQNILKAFNVNFIEDKNILGKEIFNKFGTKKNIIENILGKYINDKAIFIDDLYEHLEPCKGINNLKLIQANWGYVHDNEKSPYLLNEHETIEKLKGKI